MFRSFKGSLTTASVVLVIKRGVEDVKDFRPISLVWSLYKFMVKFLVERLKRVVSLVVSYFQNVFVERRQILDVVLEFQIISRERFPDN